ncbi:LOW QUALITY PROTEIN: uncharacterized protein RCH25_017760 [Pelodytes ibericus]
MQGSFLVDKHTIALKTPMTHATKQMFLQADHGLLPIPPPISTGVGELAMTPRTSINGVRRRRRRRIPLDEMLRVLRSLIRLLCERPMNRDVMVLRDQLWRLLGNDHLLLHLCNANQRIGHENGKRIYEPINPWEDIKLSQGTLPAAPTTTTTVLNASNTGELQVTTKKLKPHEMDAIVKEIGHVPQHDINRFLQWFCDFQRVSNMYSLTVEDVERVLQRVIGNGLWARIKQTCGEHRRTKEVLKELLRALYGIASNVSLSGKIKQLKQESPYELSSVIMALLVPTNPGFVEGDIVHRVMFMDALEESIREEILCVTPDPRDLNDILLRADNLWRKKERWFAVDSARVFRVEGQQRKEVFNPNSYSTGNKNQQMGQNSQVHRGRDRHDNGERQSRPGIPFNEIRSKRDRLQEQLDRLKEELSNLKVDVKVAEVEAERGHRPGALDFS